MHNLTSFWSSLASAWTPTVQPCRPLSPLSRAPDGTQGGRAGTCCRPVRPQPASPHPTPPRPRINGHRGRPNLAQHYPCFRFACCRSVAAFLLCMPSCSYIHAAHRPRPALLPSPQLCVLPPCLPIATVQRGRSPSCFADLLQAMYTVPPSLLPSHSSAATAHACQF